MLNQVPENAYMEYKYIEEVRDAHDIIPVNDDNDIIVKTLNYIRQTFTTMYNDFIRLNELEKAKEIYYH